MKIISKIKGLLLSTKKPNLFTKEQISENERYAKNLSEEIGLNIIFFVHSDLSYGILQVYDYIDDEGTINSDVANVSIRVNSSFAKSDRGLLAENNLISHDVLFRFINGIVNESMDDCRRESRERHIQNYLLFRERLHKLMFVDKLENELAKRELFVKRLVKV